MYKDLFNDKKMRAIAWVVLILAVALFLWLTAPKSASKTRPNNSNVNNALVPAANMNAGTNGNTNAPKTTVKKPAAPKVTGFVEKKTPHYVAANVANNATLTMQPATVTVTFDALIIKSTESFITVKRDQIYSAALGDSYIGGDGRTININVNPQTTSGDYYVYYVACFADTGCKDGRFGYHLKVP